MLGRDTSPEDGFAVSWDTTEVPNQGLRSREAARVSAIALDSQGAAVGGRATRWISVANAGEDGSYRYHVLGTCAKGPCTVELYDGPGYSSYPTVGRKARGDEVDIVCQAAGESADASRSSEIWNRLSDGTWIANQYVDTPAAGAFSPPIPICEQ